MGIEPICDQLLFLQGISLRRYTTILPASERQDLNLQPPAPKAGALPTAPLSDLRKMRDSNPGTFLYGGFQDQCNRPLCQSSDEPPIGLEPTTV